MAENTTQLNKPAFSFKDLIVPGMIVLVLLFMIFPLPTAALDAGLALNLAISFLILLVTLFIMEPLQFSSFPSAGFLLLKLQSLHRFYLNIKYFLRLQYG